MDVLRAVHLQALSGAPKVRAMEIIDELEHQARHLRWRCGLFKLERQYGYRHCHSHGGH